MTNDFTRPGGADYDDPREIAYLPHHVRALQTEVATVVNKCIHELDTVCELLLALESPCVRSDRVQPASGSQPAGPYERPAPPTNLEYAIPADHGDFDTRLANLKKLLAEKLIDREPTTK